MTSSLWGPDGQWLGRPEPSTPPPAVAPPEPGAERAARFAGVGCLSLVGLGLLLPALLLGLFALASGASDETARTTATVVAVEPGRDAFGRQPYCFTVAYVVDGQAQTARTCSVSFATSDEQERRFAEAHPPGSRVEVRYEVDDPGQLSGGVAEVGTDSTGGSPALTVVLALLALLCVAGSFGAFYGALRLVRRRRGRKEHANG